MSWQEKLHGTYAVLDRDDPDLARALLRHARVLQLRLKDASGQELLRIAKWLGPMVASHQALFVINDHLDLALELGADGVHLGQDDLPLADARSAARGRQLLIGISTHTPEQVSQAVNGGADYLGFGPVFSTSTKSNPDPVVGLEGLAQAVELAGTVPVIAIGGVTLESSAALAATGAWGACAISAVNGAEDPAAAAAALARAFAPSAGSAS